MKTEITPGQRSGDPGFDMVMTDDLPEPSVLPTDRDQVYGNTRKKDGCAGRSNPHPDAPVTQDACRCRCFAVVLAQPGRAAHGQAPKRPSRRHPHVKTAGIFAGFTDIASIRIRVRLLST